MTTLAILNNYLVTANPDGSVPLNAKLIAELKPHGPEELMAAVQRANRHDHIDDRLKTAISLMRNTFRVLDNYKNLDRDDPAQIQYALADLRKFIDGAQP